MGKPDGNGAGVKSVKPKRSALLGPAVSFGEDAMDFRAQLAAGGEGVDIDRAFQGPHGDATGLAEDQGRDPNIGIDDNDQEAFADCRAASSAASSARNSLMMRGMSASV